MNENILKKILLIILLAVIIAGTFYKDFYPIDEWRYVVITQDLGNSFIKLKYAGDDYFEKPPFYFWILYAFTKIFGMFNFISFKLPNIIALLVFIIVFTRYLRNFLSDYATFLIVFFSIPINMVSVQLVRMDFLMNIFINLSILTILRQLIDSREDLVLDTCPSIIRSSSFIFSGLFSSIAVSIKGPAGFFIPFFVIFIILIREKQFKMRYVIYFLLGFVPIIFLWFLSGYIYYGKSYIDSYILKETAGRIIYGKHHQESFLYYFLFFLPCILPYSLVFFAGIKYIYVYKFRPFLYWIILSIIVLSLSKSKLVIYLSSLIFPVSVIVSKIFEKGFCTKVEEYLIRITIIIFVTIFILILLFSVLVSENIYSPILNYLRLPESRVVLLVLIFVSLFFCIVKINQMNFLLWWIIAISFISFFLYNKLNRHYDVKKIIDTISTECKNNNIYVYKWKLLYYFKWRMHNNNIKFTTQLPKGEDSCIITSKKVCDEDKLDISSSKMLPFSRDGGIVMFKIKR